MVSQSSQMEETSQMVETSEETLQVEQDHLHRDSQPEETLQMVETSQMEQDHLHRDGQPEEALQMVETSQMEEISQMEQDYLHTDGQPGPHDDTVLTLQSHHRSALIWEGDEVSTYHPLTLRRCDGAFQEAYPRAPERVRDAMDVAGFGGVARASHLQVDHALVTALVERWRPETHTFHLPVGEATITLQDVAIIWGLRVDGDPVINNTHSLKKSEWQVKCEELLGFRPDDSQISGNRIMKSAVEPLLLVPLPDDATDDEVAQRARRFILILIGGHLFSDKSGKFLPLKYLLFLEDLQHSGTCSWGSAVLAYLYRCLCTAARAEAREICGPMVLLQIWAWERIPVLRPGGKPPVSLPNLAPYGARWVISLDLHRLPTHVLVAYRDQLDALCHDQFVWLPYSEEVIQSLPPQYVEGSDIWCSSVPLICWGIIEYHLPARVMRQFGLEQVIPPECDTDRDLHRTDQRGNDKKTWRTFYARHVDAWSRRRECIMTGCPAADVHVPLSEYMDWYLQITRLLIGNPSFHPDDWRGYQSIGASSVIMARTMRRCHRICDDAISRVRDVDQLLAMFATVRDAINNALNVAGDSFGCVPSIDVDIQSTCNVHESLRRPKHKIEGRGHPGHRIGGKRRLQDRDLGDIRHDPHVPAPDAEGEASAPPPHVPVDPAPVEGRGHPRHRIGGKRRRQDRDLGDIRYDPHVPALNAVVEAPAPPPLVPVDPLPVDSPVPNMLTEEIQGPEGVTQLDPLDSSSEAGVEVTTQETVGSEVAIIKKGVVTQVEHSVSDAEDIHILVGPEVAVQEANGMTHKQVDALVSDAEDSQIPMVPEVAAQETEIIRKDDPLVSDADVIQRSVGSEEDQVIHRYSKRPRRRKSHNTPR